MTSTASMKPTCYRAGKTRQVCVNRKAIEYNMKNGTNYPTTIVVEDGKLHEYHTVRANGDLSFDRHRTDLPAKVFIETRDEIVGYLNPYTEHQSFLNLNIPTGMWVGIKKRFYSFMGWVPIANCLVDFEGMRQRLEQPKKQFRNC